MNETPIATMRRVVLLAMVTSAASFHSVLHRPGRPATGTFGLSSAPPRPFLAVQGTPGRVSRHPIATAAELAQEPPQEEPMGRFAKIRAAMPPKDELKKSKQRTAAPHLSVTEALRHKQHNSLCCSLS